MMIAVLLGAAILGFCISLYAYFVEGKIKENPTYRPACDINDRISCSKPLQSPYSNLFFVSNSVLGMIYYSVVALLTMSGLHTLLLIATASGVLVSCVLGYLLYFKIRAICLVCTSLYIINAVLFIASIY